MKPPQELTARRENLMERIANNTKTILANQEENSRLQSENALFKEKLKYIDETISEVYGRTSELPKDDVPLIAPIAVRPQPRKISGQEYRAIVVNYLKEHGQASYKELREHAATMVGFPVTLDMIKGAVKVLLKDTTVPMVKLARGYLGYRPLSPLLTNDRATVVPV